MSANSIAAQFGDIDDARGIDRHAEGRNHRQLERDTVARNADGGVAGNGRDDAIGTHLADNGISGIGDQHDALGTECDVLRTGKSGQSGRAGVAIVTLVSRAGEDIDDAIRGDAADGVVGGSGDIDVVGGIHRDRHGQVNIGIGGRSRVAPEAGDGDIAVAREGGDNALRIDHADAIVQGIGNIEVTGRIQRDALGRVQLRADGGTAITGEAGSRVTRDQGQRPGAIDLEDRVSAAEIRVAAGKHDFSRLTDRRGEGRNGGGRRRAAGNGRNCVLLRKGRRACHEQERESQHAVDKSIMTF